MTFLFAVALKVSGLMLFALAASAVLRRRSAALRHWMLAAAVIAAAAMPALVLVSPAWHVPMASAGSPGDRPAVDEAIALAIHLPASSPALVGSPDAVGRVPASRGATVAAAIWAGGTIAWLLSIAAGLVRLRGLSRRSRPASDAWVEPARAIEAAYGIPAPVPFRETDHPSILVAWGAGRPEVLLPAGAAAWPADRIRSVAAHELAHVARADWLFQVVAELLRAMHWYNPFVWLVLRRLRQASEQASDDAVLRLGIANTTYAAHLLDVARACRRHRRDWLPAPAIARPSTLQQRIRAMLNTHIDRRPLTVRARLAVATATAMAAVSVASLGAQPFSSVSGTVTDPSGQPIAGATVVLTNPDRESRHEVKSDGTGTFALVGLLPGSYELTITRPGFAVLRDAITLSGGEALRRPVRLDVGTVQESITVSDAPAVSRPAGQQAAPAPKPCTPSGGHIVPPMKVRDVRPEHPGDGGAPVVVSLHAQIGADGLVHDIRLTTSAPAEFERAAVAAVSQWQFTPTLLNCEPIPVQMSVTVSFR